MSRTRRFPAAAMPALALLLWVSPVRAQFEGVIEMKVTSRTGDSSQSAVYTMSVRKGMLAATVDRAGPEGGEFIFRGDKNVLWIINRTESSYLEIHTPERDEEQPKSPAGGGLKHFQETGRVDTILGYPCRELTADEGAVQVWATDRLGDIYESLAKSFGGLGAGGSGGWEEELSSMHIFPLRLTSRQGAGSEETQQVTRIEPRTMPDGLFNPPPGFRRDSIDINVESLMKKLGSEPDSTGNK